MADLAGRAIAAYALWRAWRTRHEEGPLEVLQRELNALRASRRQAARVLTVDAAPWLLGREVENLSTGQMFHVSDVEGNCLTVEPIDNREVAARQMERYYSMFPLIAEAHRRASQLAG